MTDSVGGADLVLLAGLWLPDDIWADVGSQLDALGHRWHVPQLAGDATTDLDGQLAALLQVVDALPNPVVVGHSAAATLAWLAADRRPDRVRQVVMIGGFPESDGSTYADLFPMVDGAMPFPGWEPFEGPDSAGLDEAAQQAFTEITIPVPEQVARGVVRLSDERRFAVPVTLVCPEFSAQDARSWIGEGELPELAAVLDLRLVDIDSGHWPMVTRPQALARLLSDVVWNGSVSTG